MFDSFRKHKPIIHDLNKQPPLNPWFKGIQTQVPAKVVANTRNNMDLLRMYTHGVLKWENTGRSCGNCVNYYPDKGSRLGGRCRAYGFKEVHPDTPADDTPNWIHPSTGENFLLWPGCPEYISKERLSRR